MRAGDRKFALLLFLAVRFAIGAWKIYRAHRSVEFQAPKSERRGGFLFGHFVVLMSPWNFGFWPAVIDSQPAQSASVRQSLAIAVAVVLGALTWGVVLCTALKFGAHLFSHPNWQVATEATTAAVMLCFAIRLLLHFHEPDYRTTDRNPDDQRDLSLDSG